MAAARKSVSEKEFWENLVILALLRSGKCKTDRSFGLRVNVDIEDLEEELKEQSVLPNQEDSLFITEADIQ